MKTHFAFAKILLYVFQHAVPNQAVEQKQEMKVQMLEMKVLQGQEIQIRVLLQTEPEND